MWENKLIKSKKEQKEFVGPKINLNVFLSGHAVEKDLDGAEKLLIDFLILLNKIKIVNN